MPHGDTAVDESVPLSAQGRAILQALAAAPAGVLPMGDVVRLVRRPAASSAVTRASVSRTLRRLWAGGCVELSADDEAQTLTAVIARREQRERQYRAVALAPEAAYQAYLDFRARLRANGEPVRADPYGSAARYLAAFRDEGCAPPVRARRVQLTAHGRAVLTDEHQP